MRRPELQRMLREIKPGDTVVVYKMDRIARSLKDLLYLVERMESSGAQFQSLTELIDTKSPAGRMIFQIIGAFAEFERAIIRERTRAGMAAAIKRGSVLGRPKALPEEKEEEAMRLWMTGQHSKTSLAKQYGCHISSIKRAISRRGLPQNKEDIKVARALALRERQQQFQLH